MKIDKFRAYLPYVGAAVAFRNSCATSAIPLSKTPTNCGTSCSASLRDPGVYGCGVFVFDPLHYLALIETKPNALDQSAPSKDWGLPETFQHLRHLLEPRMGNRGKREFIQVLRLMEALPREVVTFAIIEAIRFSAIGFDAVKQNANVTDPCTNAR